MDGFLLEIMINSALGSLVFASLVLLTLCFMQKSSAATKYAVLIFSLFIMLLMPLASGLAPSSTIFNLVNFTIGPPSGAFARHLTYSGQPDKPDLPIELNGGGNRTQGLIRDPANRVLAADSNNAATWWRRMPLYLISLWAIGFILQLILHLLRFRQIRKIFLSSYTPIDSDLVELAGQIARSHRLKKSFEILVNDRLPAPLVCGLFAPRVILPADYIHWSRTKTEAVLCHELSHIIRSDNLMDMAVQLATAFYWFNPFIYVIRKRVRIERESACDDRAVNRGIAPSDYARYLLEIIASVQNHEGRLIPAAISYTSQTKERFMRILSPHTNRKPVNPSRLVLLVIIILALALPVAAFRPVALIESSNDEKNDSGSLITIDEKENGQKEITISGNGEIYQNNTFPATYYYSDDSALTKNEYLFSEEYYKDLKKQARLKNADNRDDLEISEDSKLIAYTRGSYSFLPDGRVKLIAVEIYDESEDWKIWGKDAILSNNNGEIEWELLEPNGEIMVTRKVKNMKLEYIIGGDFAGPVFLVDHATYPFEKRQMDEFKYMMNKAYNILK